MRDDHAGQQPSRDGGEPPRWAVTLPPWLPRRFTDPQFLVLAALTLVAFTLVFFFGQIFAPAIAAIVLAYLLAGPVAALERWGMAHISAVLIVFTGFLACLFVVVFALLPALVQQLIELVQQLPIMVGQAQRALVALPEKYPKLVSQTQVDQFVGALQTQVILWGQFLLSQSVASLVILATAAVYLFLVPFVVFFLLKDGKQITLWLRRFLPRDRDLAAQVWSEIDRQLSNYVRGKFWEILLIAGVSCATFVLLGLRYALLIGVASGLSLLVPYIGVMAAAVPLVAIAYFQWGIAPEFFYTTGAYVVIHIIDGNIVAPLLLSEATSLHPLAIVVSILFFGGIWGVWGLFFAVPLATVVQALLNALQIPPAEDAGTRL